MSMEFWGIEVKPGETVKVDIEDKYLHLSQAALGEAKDKGKENVPLFVKVNDQKLVLGTLSAEKCPQFSFDLVFEQGFELSHSSKNASVYFCGYKSLMVEEDDDEGFPNFSDSDEDAQIGQNVNGKPKAKDEPVKSVTAKANAVKEDNSAAKPNAKKAEPIKAKPMANDEDDEDDEDDDDEDEDSEDEDESGSDEDMLSDSDDEGMEESSEEDDEATPKKVETGKKRAAESASKTPVPEKKAKVVTPAGGQKTGGDGKKGGHTATPYPKQVGKTPANSDKAKQQTPKSGGSVTCKSCSKSFNSDNALQAHTKAKHGGTN